MCVWWGGRGSFSSQETCGNIRRQFLVGMMGGRFAAGKPGVQRPVMLLNIL